MPSRKISADIPSAISEHCGCAPVTVRHPDPVLDERSTFAQAKQAKCRNLHLVCNAGCAFVAGMSPYAAYVIDKVVTVTPVMRYSVICPPRSTRRTTGEELGGSLWDFAYFFLYAVLLRHCCTFRSPCGSRNFVPPVLASRKRQHRQRPPRPKDSTQFCGPAMLTIISATSRERRKAQPRRLALFLFHFLRTESGSPSGLRLRCFLFTIPRRRIRLERPQQTRRSSRHL